MNSPSRKPLLYRSALGLSVALLAWGVFVYVTGGVEFEFAGATISSTHPARVFWLAAAAFAAGCVIAGRQRIGADLAALGRGVTRGGRAGMALVAASLVAGIGLGVVTTTGFSAPPDGHRPLPVIATTPEVLDDAAEIRTYVNAFPVEEYRQYQVPRVGRFFIDRTDDDIKRTIAAGDPWDRHVLRALEAEVRPGTVVLEIGAHIGTHTVPIARWLGPWGRIYAFEPQRKVFRELHHNLELNGLTNAVPLRFALGSGDTRIIEMNPATPGNEGGTGVGQGGDRVELRSLDSFGFERVSLIKIDAEHYENEVLDGAVETIRRNRPVILLEIMGGQYYETAPPEVRERIHVTWRKLERLGYEVSPLMNHDYIARPLDEVKSGPTTGR